MKGKQLMPSLSVLILFILLFFCCRKSEKINTSDDVRASSLKSMSCSAPDYGDSIIYSKWQGPNNDYSIKPKNNKFAGRWFAWPEGLLIDSTTGEINVSASETGVRYKVGFVKSGTQDTCTATLILGGITYVDSIYNMAKNDTLAFPYYYANPTAPSICDISDDTDYPTPGGNGHGNNKCEFDDDEDDDLNNGQADEPPAGSGANKQGVWVRTVSGVINLKKTMADVFGPNPQNGDTKKVDIYYRLNDRSSKALQKLSVRFIYYNLEAEIPIYLKHEIRVKRNSFYSYMTTESDYKPRPPMIILTRASE
jgi:hypothetical protein